jgi:hypothetical protein
MQANSQMKVKLSITQKRYGKAELNKSQEINTDKLWFGEEGHNF